MWGMYSPNRYLLRWQDRAEIQGALLVTRDSQPRVLSVKGWLSPACPISQARASLSEYGVPFQVLVQQKAHCLFP